MVRVFECSYEHERYTDPDSYLGIEERINFADPMHVSLFKVAQVFDACDYAKMRDAYVCYCRPGMYREKIYVCEPSQYIVDKLSTWRGDMLFYKKETVQLYLAARPRFDQEKLMLMLMKGPEGVWQI